MQPRAPHGADGAGHPPASPTDLFAQQPDRPRLYRGEATAEMASPALTMHSPRRSNLSGPALRERRAALQACWRRCSRRDLIISCALIGGLLVSGIDPSRVWASRRTNTGSNRTDTNSTDATSTTNSSTRTSSDSVRLMTAAGPSPAAFTARMSGQPHSIFRGQGSAMEPSIDTSLFAQAATRPGPTERTAPPMTSPFDPARPAAIQSEHVPVIPPDLRERLRQYQNTRGAGFLGWSPDGKGLLIATRFADSPQLHRVYEPGGRREQITFFQEPCSGAFLPEARDGAILLSMDQGGNENNQILLLDRQTGRATLLTDGKSRNLLGPILHDGSQVIIESNRRNNQDTDLYIANPRQADSMKMLLETKNERWSAVDWSRDGSRLLMRRYVSINESYPALLDAATGKLSPIKIPGGGPAAYGAMAFTPDGKTAYMATDALGEFRQLARVDLATFEHTLLSRDIPWDVESIVVEPKSGLVAFSCNEDGAEVLYLLDGTQRRRIELPLGLLGGLEFSPDGQRLGFSLARANSPADAYSIDIKSGQLTRWTYSEVGGLNPETFITPQLVRFKSFDDRMIPAYVFKPRTASKDKPAPVLIDIHGGPESQYRPGFSGPEQFYLNELGIATIHPNVRGSDGYGKTYLKLDNGMKREDSVRDIGALLDWIATQPDLDKSRVMVIGGSYGGYMVLASLVHYSDRIKAGIDVVGIANFITFLKNTSAYRRDLRRAEYGDERIPEMEAFFHKINPAQNSHKIRSPLMVIHGRNDPRVPFSEAEQIVAQVRANGKQVWTIYADNEGHGFDKKANRDYQSWAVVLFLKEHLLK